MRPSTRTLVLALVRHGKGILSAVEAFVEAEDALQSGHHRGLAGASAGSPATAPLSPPRVTTTSDVTRET